MLYTVGNEENYDSGLATLGERFMKKGADGMYPGGFALRTVMQAKRLIIEQERPDWAVYAIDAEFMKDTRGSKHGWWHGLRRDARILFKVQPVMGIMAMDETRTIGKGGKLPWNNPKDMAFFRRTTMGHPVIMGRTTFEGMGRKPLAGRRNIIMSRQPDLDLPEGAERASDLMKVLHGAKHDTTPFVIGGLELYSEAMRHLDEFYVTEIKGSHEGDTWMPEFEMLFNAPEVVEEHPDARMLKYTRNWTRTRWTPEPLV